MNAEQITTIITNVLTGSGVIFLVGMVIRGLKNRINEMNKTIEVQQQTLKAMETRVLETEKIGKIYRQLFEELLTEAEKWKAAILKFKDERISIHEQANQNKDDKQTNTVKIEFEKIIDALNALELRANTVNQLTPVNYLAVMNSAEKISSMGALTKKERAVCSSMSANTEEDLKTGVDIWSLLYCEPNPLTAKTIASKLFLDQATVNPILERLLEGGCVETVDDTQGRTAYRAVISKQ